MEKISYRPYQSEDDFWRMRAFLREVFILNGFRERAWHVARLEYARWHVCLNCHNLTLDQVAHLWESDGKLVAIAMPDGGPDEAHFMIHPAYEIRALEEEMLAVAEEKLSIQKEDGQRFLGIWAMADDPLRREMLTEHGYERKGWVETQHRRDLSLPIPDVKVPDGYTLRSLGVGLELLERCYASGLGFHEGDIKIAVENRDDITWYRNIQNAALYRRDLDLVAVADDGSIASFCTIWFDDVTRSAYYEPVATVPAHQRRGLSRALLTLGLHKLKRMGCLWAFVGGFEEGPNQLYETTIGPAYGQYQSWVKTW
jgi:GNAT superfamily N-acetyltransferase